MKKELLKEIYNKYNLHKDDIFVLKFGGVDKPIITRAGIEKIQAQLNIQVNFKIEKISDDFKNVVVLANAAIMRDNPEQKGQQIPYKIAQTFGEVSPSNNKSNYPIAMAEKRALGRAVIKLANLYGVYTEDDSEDFKK